MKAWLATNKNVPKCCRRKIGGHKERLLMEAYQKIEKSMHIDKLLRTVLTSKGILKNDIKETKVDWLSAKERYSKIYSP